MARKAPENDNLNEQNPSGRYANILYTASLKYSFPNKVIARYLTLVEKGNKRTMYFKWLVPLAKKIVPYTSLRVAFLTSFFLPFLLVILPVCLLLKLLIFLN